jgi:glycogen debranching enzyme
MRSEVAMEYGESLMEVSDIIGSLVIREGNLSLITELNGNIPLGEEQGSGCITGIAGSCERYAVRLNGRLLTSILSSDEKDYASTIVMTNRDFTDNCGRAVRKNSITIRRDRVIPGFVEERISIVSHNQLGVDVCLELESKADFNDIFTIRGITRNRDGELMAPV